jgi:signal transduction histidine kinase
MWKIYNILLLAVVLIAFKPLLCEASEDKNATNEKVLVAKFVKGFYDKKNMHEFINTGEELKSLYAERGNQDKYYRVWINEICYFADAYQIYKGLYETNEMQTQALQEKNYYGLAQSYYALGLLYGKRGNQILALENYKKSLSIFNKYVKKANTSEVYWQIANLYIDDSPKEADRQAKLAIRFAGNKIYDLCYGYAIECMVSLHLDDEKGFRYYYDLFVKTSKKDKTFPAASYKYYFVSIDRFFKHDYPGALSAADSIEIVEDRAEMRYLLCTKIGNPIKTLQSYKKLIEVKDSISAIVNGEDFLAMSRDADAVKIKKVQGEMKYNLYLIVTLGVIFLFLFVVISFMYYGHIKHKELERMNHKNKELRKAWEKAEESDRLKEDFIRNISHEIRTPLNAIAGFSQIITSSDMNLDDDMRKEMSQRINDNSLQLTGIIDNMLELSLVESNRDTPQKEKILCSEFFNKIIIDMKPFAKDNVQLSYSSRFSDHFEIYANRVLLTKVMQKLLDNACKFTEKGYIRIFCSCDDDKTKYVITVTDSGIPIPIDKAEIIFEKFVKLNDFLPGAGIGLTSCRSLVMRMGGTVTLDTSYTDGNRFVVSIPTI